MSLKYALIFLVLAAGCAVAAVSMWDVVDWLGALFLYPVLSFLLLTIAYAGAGPKLLFKKESGRRSVWSWLLFAPYFGLNSLLLGACRIWSNEPAFVQIAPNLYFGRKLSSRESRAIDWVGVLDLAVEFAEVRALRALAGYKSLPILDAMAPDKEQLRSAVCWLSTAVTKGPVYVHCALGHGRSACVVIAYLLSIGEIRSVSEGVQRLRSFRPGIGLNSEQLRRLRELESSNSDPSRRR